jgi:hypothetical protein
MILAYLCSKGHQNFIKVKVQQAGCLSHGPHVICKVCFAQASYNDELQEQIDAAVLTSLEAMFASMESDEPTDTPRVN